MEIDKLLKEGPYVESVSVSVNFKDGSSLSFKRENDNFDDIVDEDSD